MVSIGAINNEAHMDLLNLHEHTCLTKISISIVERLIKGAPIKEHRYYR